MFRARRDHHQERQILSIQPLVTVILFWWPRCVQVGRVFFQPAHISATNIYIEIHRKEFVHHVVHLPRTVKYVVSNISVEY